MRPFEIGRACGVPVIVSHLKCAGIANWGRSDEVLHALDLARDTQRAGCDCYPYAAGSSTLDLRQVDPRVEITITWSTRIPKSRVNRWQQIAETWNVTQMEAADRLRPAGAIYHSISEQDMRRILRASGDHDRFRRIAQRSPPTSALVGNVSARAGPLQPRRKAVPSCGKPSIK